MASKNEQSSSKKGSSKEGERAAAGKAGEQGGAASDISEVEPSWADDKAALYKQVELNRAILNAAVDAIITIDTKGIIVAVNPATENIFGYSEREMLGKNISMLMPSPHRDMHDGYLANYQKTGEAHVIGIGREVIGQRKDGSTFPADLAVSEVDHLGYYTGIIRDISARRHIEDTARREHDFTESLIDTVQSVVLVLDSDGRIVRFNSVLEKISGRSLEDCEGRDWFDTFLPKEDRRRIHDLFLEVASRKVVRGNINSIVTDSGKRVEIEWQSAPLRDRDGIVIGIVCSGTDVSERLRLEAEVYRASEEEKISVAQDLHDSLGSLLTGIGYLAGALSANMRRGVSIGVEDTDRIVDRINDAISQTRSLAHGLLGIGHQPDALPSALKELVSWVRSSSTLMCRFSCFNPGLVIADQLVASHVFRIAQEAVNNAIRHSHAEHLTIRIEPAADDNVCLTVLDNGRGFDPAALSNRGIGLRTMEYRARAIGARLEIQNRKKGGTRVECVFSNV